MPSSPAWTATSSPLSNDQRSIVRLGRRRGFSHLTPSVGTPAARRHYRTFRSRRMSRHGGGSFSTGRLFNTGRGIVTRKTGSRSASTDPTTKLRRWAAPWCHRHR
jgi:hypothetical protein